MSLSYNSSNSSSTSSYFFKPYSAREIARIRSIYLRSGDGWIFLPNNRATASTLFTDKTVAEVLTGKHPPERKTHFSTLKVYEETPIFILVDIMEDVVELVARKILGILDLGGTDSEAL